MSKSSSSSKKVNISMNSNNMKNTQLITILITLALLVATYFYLTKLESCVCVNGVETKYVADIKKLRYIEIFFIIVAIISLLNVYFVYKLQNKSLLLALSSIYFIILVIIDIYLLLHVLRLYKNMPNDCECALKWPRYYLYLQAFFAAISLFFIFLSFLVLILASFTYITKK